jgi:hypothetical protein
MMSAANLNAGETRTDWRRHLAWEVPWLAVELAGVAVGLYLVNGAAERWSGLGVVWLGLVLMASFAVRALRYGRLAGERVGR